MAGILAAMSDDLTPGLHESLVTEALEARLEKARAQGWLIELKAIDDALLSDILARYIHERARARIGGLSPSLTDRRQTQVDLTNRVLEVLAEYSTDRDATDVVDPRAQLLLQVETPSPGRTRQSRPRPGIPLRDSVLLVNGHKDLQIGAQVALEIQSADRVDLLCAFVRFAGVR